MITASVDGLTFDYHGSHTTNLRPVLLSSGLGGAAGFWQPQLEPLLNAGYHVITYDQRGTGRSKAKLPDHYTIKSMAADVASILAAVAVRSCHFVGHALGGLVGLELARTQAKLTTSLTLINAWGSPNTHSARCFDVRLRLLSLAGPEAYVQAQPLFLYPAAWSAANNDKVVAEIAHGLAHFQGEGNLRARIAALRSFDVELALPNISVRTLISAAKDDVLVPWTASLQLAKLLPFATLDLTTEGAHAHNVTQAQAFNRRLLQFLIE